PDAAPGELARQVLLAARASAQASEKLLDRLAIQATTEGISLIRAERLGKPATAGARRLVERAREELYEYFQGKRAFFSVPVDLSETPDFQRRVLEAARRMRPDNRVVFASVQDARSVRYRPCKVCKPSRAA